MKILKWTFTKENAYSLLNTFVRFIAPSGLGGVLLASFFTDPLTAAKVAGVVAFLNTIARATQLLVKPVPTTPSITY